MQLWHMHPADVGRMTLRDFWMCTEMADESKRAADDQRTRGR